MICVFVTTDSVRTAMVLVMQVQADCSYQFGILFLLLALFFFILKIFLNSFFKIQVYTDLD